MSDYWLTCPLREYHLGLTPSEAIDYTSDTFVQGGDILKSPDNAL